MKITFSTDPRFSSDTPLVRKHREALNRLRDGLVLDTYQAAARLGTIPSVLREISRCLSGYHYLFKHKLYWANKATIKQLKKELRKSK